VKAVNAMGALEQSGKTFPEEKVLAVMEVDLIHPSSAA
jgi:hypothetical protein